MFEYCARSTPEGHSSLSRALAEASLEMDAHALDQLLAQGGDPFASKPRMVFSPTGSKPIAPPVSVEPTQATPQAKEPIPETVVDASFGGDDDDDLDGSFGFCAFDPDLLTDASVKEAKTPGPIIKPPLEQDAHVTAPTTAPTTTTETQPLHIRLTDKAWKVRLAAYKEARAALSSSALDYAALRPHLCALAADANIPARTEAYKIMTLWFKGANADASIAEAVLPALLQHGFGSGRAALQTDARDMCAAMAQRHGAAKAVVHALAAATGHRQWKLAQHALVTLTHCIAQQAVDPVAFATILCSEPMKHGFGHSQQHIREAALDLCKHLHQAMGTAFAKRIPSMKLKRQQEKELRAALQLKDEKEDEEEDHAPAKPAPVVHATTGPIDIAAALSKGWIEQVRATKWKQRLAAVTEVTTRLAPASDVVLSHAFSPVHDALVHILAKDVNINVVARTLHALTLLAQGAKTHFAPYARTLVPIVLCSTRKSNKPAVNKHATALLDAIYMHQCVTLADVHDALTTALQDKVVKVRIDALTWLLQCLEKEAKLSGDSTKALGKALMAIGNDADATVRDGAVQGLVRILATTTDAHASRLRGAMERKDPKLLARVDASTSTSTRPVAAAASLRKRRRSVLPKPLKKGRKKRAATKKRKSLARQPTKQADHGTAAATDVLEQDAAVEMLTACGVPALTRVGAMATVKKWQEVVAWLTDVKEAVEALPTQDVGRLVEAMLVCFSSKPLAYVSHSNLNIVKAAFACLETVLASPALADSAWLVSRAGWTPLLKQLVGKAMGDRKLASLAHSLLFLMSDICGPDVVVGRVITHAAKLKNIKALIADLQWITECTKAFGTNAVPPKPIIQAGRGWAESSNKAVRNAVMELFGELYRQGGTQSRNRLVKGFKPALVTELDKVFAALPHDQLNVIAPTRTMRRRGGEAGKAAEKDAKEAPVERRIDLSAKVSASLLKQLDCDRWKERKAALDAVAELLGGMLVSGNDGGIMHALRLRLRDSNKNLVLRAVKLMGVLVKAMTPENAAKFTNKIVPSIMVCLSDAKKGIVTAAATTIQDWMDQTGLQAVIKHMGTALSASAARPVLLDMLSKQLAKMDATVPLQMGDLVDPVLQCALGRNADVRAMAHSVLQSMCARGLEDAIAKAIADMKRSDALALKPILASFRKTQEAEEGPDETVSDMTEEPEPEPEDTQAILPLMDRAMRKERTSRDLATFSKAPLQFDAPIVSELHGIFEHEFAESHLRTLLLSADPTDAVRAFDMLEEVRSEESERFDVIADLFFKLCAVRLHTMDSAELTSSILSFLHSTMVELPDRGFVMSDGEAAVLLPTLIELVMGHSVVTFREQCGLLLRETCNAYPVSKVAGFLVHALNHSQNERVATECLDLLGDIIERYGITCVNPATVIPCMATKVRATASVAADVKDAALEALATTVGVYRASGAAQGDDVWEMMTKAAGSQAAAARIGPMARIDIEARLRKRATRGKRVSHVPRSRASSLAPSEISDAESLLAPEEELAAAAENRPVFVAQQDERSAFDSAWLVSLQSEDDTIRLEAMKQIWRLLNGAEGSSIFTADTDAPQLNQLVELLTGIIDYSFETQDGEVIRFRQCRYGLNVLMETFKKQALVDQIAFVTVKNLFSTLLSRLLDTRLVQEELGRGLIRAMNTLMLRILEGTNRTDALKSLLTFLSSSVYTKIHPLTCKCVDKITRKLSDGRTLDVGVVLTAIHDFFESSMFAGENAEEDKACRVVRALVNKMLDVFGFEVVKDASRLPMNCYTVRLMDKLHGPAQENVVTAAVEAVHVPPPRAVLAAHRSPLKLRVSSPSLQNRKAAATPTAAETSKSADASQSPAVHKTTAESVRQRMANIRARMEKIKRPVPGAIPRLGNT